MLGLIKGLALIYMNHIITEKQDDVQFLTNLKDRVTNFQILLECFNIEIEHGHVLCKIC